MKKIAISGIIGWDITANDLREALAQANGDDVEITFTTPGGLVSEGLAMFNMIRNYPGHTKAVLAGYAMSMGSYIPLAADEVLVEDNAVYMVHNARGGVWGDHNDILSYGQFVKGLSGLLGKQYVKTTGRDTAEITEWMDKETFFFGEEAVTMGFAHGVIVGSKRDDDDKALALAAARAVFTDTMAKLGSDAAKARDDMAKASAIMGLATINPPAVAGISPKEDQQMNLTDLLAQHPTAKAEFDAALAKSRSEGETAGKTAMQETISAVAPFLGNAEYPKAIGNTALAVLKGETGLIALTSAVAAVDAVREEAAATAAATATGAQGGTPAQAPAGRADDETVTDAAGLDEEIARFSRKEG